MTAVSDTKTIKSTLAMGDTFLPATRDTENKWQMSGFSREYPHWLLRNQIGSSDPETMSLKTGGLALEVP